MVDLVVTAGTTLQIDASFAVAPKYDLFKMEANSVIRTSVDLAIHATKAEFDINCVIDARGASGPMGTNGQNGLAQGQAGQPGGVGGAGQRGSNISIEAALAKVGGLMIIADGGGGGSGGRGGNGSDSTTFGQMAAPGGPGGQGGAGGRGGHITLSWVRAVAGLPKSKNTPPDGHVYRSDGGAGGLGGPGGMGGRMLWGAGYGLNGAVGLGGAAGPSSTPFVSWHADPSSMLWAQAQDMGPSPRSGHSMTYDFERDRLVLFGGRDARGVLDDTWEWDGKLWTQVADTGPAARSYHAAAFDPVTRQVMLFGGSRPNPSGGDDRLYFNDTWSWDGNGWTQLEDTGPSARQAAAMAADPERQRVVLFSGGQIENSRNVGTDDTWEWDGSKWTQVADTGPAARLAGAMAYDPSSPGTLLFGGAASNLLSDTWRWDGSHWTQVADTGPAARMDHAMTSVSVGTVMVGGISTEGDVKSETWLWNDGKWQLIQDMGPSQRSGLALATFGQGGEEVVTLFGGTGGGETFQDTWCFRERF